MESKKPHGNGAPDATLAAPPIEAGASAILVENPSAFPIVGIGASAGGLASFEAFFSAMPATTDSGASLVLVQHLAPDHKSILSELVRRYTRMEVFEVEDGMMVKPNCVYIIPPDRDMALLRGRLALLVRATERGPRLPIDFFFHSLARDQRERAICIVLSGTGTDGTQGVRAVKSEGGMVMAQNTESAEFGGMPRSAIATGLVDYVLPPAEMPEQLISYLDHPLPMPSGVSSARTLNDEDVFKKIFIVLCGQTGHDFSQYKETTTTRRIERRMAVHKVDRVDSYLRYLQQTPAEVEALFHDLLIGVTSFFRDPGSFKTLEDQVIPRLFAGRAANSPIRAWVPGCSSGEEAYSIAILLQERVEFLKRGFKCQVFASDIDARAIEQCRRGVYPASVLAEVSPERLARFFAPESVDGGVYRIQNFIRNQLVFSEHDLIRDPPFSRLDLISCRNLMIYMGPALQKKLVPLFHDVLNPGGFLLLGTSESVGDFPDLFATLDGKNKIYQRKEASRYQWRRTVDHLPRPVAARRGTQGPSRPHLAERGATLRDVTEQALLQQYAPVAALIDKQGDVRYLQGRTGRYLEPAPGEADVNILKMAREGLRYELTAALHRAAAAHEPVRRPGLQVKSDGGFIAVNVTVSPVAAGSAVASESSLYLVTFEEVPLADRPPSEAIAPPPGPGGAQDPAAADPKIAALRRELRAKEEYLEATNEELQTANEELTSANEELQSVNEELQSTNEELETSKEEVQSMNEELTTVNAELQERVADLSRANNDMNNLLAGTAVGTIFVDCQSRIQRFTPAAGDVFNLISTDVGRPMAHVVSNLAGYDHLEEDLQEVLDTLVPTEIEVQTKKGAWYSLRLRPYRTTENVVEGAVLTSFDITDLKRAQEALSRLSVVVRDSHAAITVQDAQGHILAWNPAAEQIYGFGESEALAKNIRELIPEPLREDELARARRIFRSELVPEYRSQRLCKDGRTLKVRVTATLLLNNRGEAYAIATTERQAVPSGR